MNQEKKVSIIIPVYNIEKYIEECVNSVLQQTYSNLEIIIVDDGSKDSSSTICDFLAQRDRRIRVIHQSNAGLSEARNKGILHTTGDYIMFLDGDDFWDDSNAIQRLIARVELTNPDVLNYSYKKYFEDTGEYIPYIHDVDDMPTVLKSKKQQADYLASNHLYIASACNKLISRTLFSENNDLLFRSGIYSEDIDWCARLLIKARSFDFVCENFYCYRQRKDSIRHTINDIKCRDLFNNIMHCFEIGNSIEDDIFILFYTYTAYQYGTFFMVQAQAENQQNRYIRELEKYKWVLSYHNKNRKIQCLYIGCKIFGMKTVCRIIRFLWKWKNADRRLLWSH